MYLKAFLIAHFPQFNVEIMDVMMLLLILYIVNNPVTVTIGDGGCEILFCPTDKIRKKRMPFQPTAGIGFYITHHIG